MEMPTKVSLWITLNKEKESSSLKMETSTKDSFSKASGTGGESCSSPMLQ